VARYWRCTLDRTLEVGGQPLNPPRLTELKNRAEREKALLRQAIRAQFDLTTQAGIVSYPASLALLEGTTHLVASSLATQGGVIEAA
jgi:hypothetical protein